MQTKGSYRVTVETTVKAQISVLVPAATSSEAILEAMDAYAVLRNNFKGENVRLEGVDAEITLEAFDPDCFVRHTTNVDSGESSAAANEQRSSGFVVRYYNDPRDATWLRAKFFESEEEAKSRVDEVIYPDSEFGYAELYDESLKRVIAKAQCRVGGLGVRCYSADGTLLDEEHWLEPAIQTKRAFAFIQRPNVARVVWTDWTDRTKPVVIKRELTRQVPEKQELA